MSDSYTPAWRKAVEPVLRSLEAIAATRDARAGIGAVEASPPIRIVISGPPGSGEEQVCELLARELHRLGFTQTSDWMRTKTSSLLVETGRKASDADAPPTAGRPTDRDPSTHGLVTVWSDRDDENVGAMRPFSDGYPADEALRACAAGSLNEPGAPSCLAFVLDNFMRDALDEDADLAALLNLRVVLARPSPEDLAFDVMRLLASRTYAVTAPVKGTLLETLELRPTLTLDDTSAVADSIALAHAQRIAGKGTPKALKTITTEDVLKASPRSPLKQTVAEVLAEFEQFVGMDDIKDRIKGFADLAIVRSNNDAAGRPLASRMGNFVFVGPPGTGKTTIARKIGEVFAALGILKSGHVESHTRASLVGDHVGETEKKTLAAIESAREGVLFIDEAYMLADNSNDKKGTIDGRHYGQIAITTLVGAMTDPNCQPFVCVVAGYPREMETFLSSNPGLSSRFSDKIQFHDYDGDELAEIFSREAKRRGIKAGEETVSAARAVLEDAAAAAGDNFGNARDAIRLVDRALEEASHRVLEAEGTAAIVRSISPRDVYQARTILPQNETTDDGRRTADYVLVEEAEDRIREQEGWSHRSRDALVDHIQKVHSGQPMGFGSVLPRAIHDILVLESSGVDAAKLAEILFDFYSGLGLLSNRTPVRVSKLGSRTAAATVAAIDSLFDNAPGRCLIIDGIEKWVPEHSDETPARALADGMRGVRDTSLVIATAAGPLEARSIPMRTLDDEFELTLD